MHINRSTIWKKFFFNIFNIFLLQKDLIGGVDKLIVEFLEVPHKECLSVVMVEFVGVVEVFVEEDVGDEFLGRMVFNNWIVE
jgi:hypothetical protein